MKIIPKYQKGGGFDSFFTLYNPVQVESPRQSSSQQRTSGDKSTQGELTQKDFFEMIKDIDGLPNEMNDIINNLVSIFQLNNLTGIDSGNLATTYLQSLNSIRLASQNKKRFDDVIAEASKNGALAEPAITMDGSLLVQDDNGKINSIDLETYNKNKDYYNSRILTVSNLADMRRYDPALIGDHNSFNIIENSIGFESFQDLLDKAKADLGNSQFSESGIYGKEALQGLSLISKLPKEKKEELLQNALDRMYGYTTSINTNTQQVQDLITYMNMVLPKRAKIWAAWKLGISDEKQAANILITQYLSGRLSDNKQLTVDFKGTMDKLSGKKSESEDSILDVEYNTAMKWLEGFGVRTDFVINPGTTNAYQVQSNTLPLTTSDGNPLGTNSTLLEASKGEYSGILDFNNASIGGKTIDPYSFGGVVLSDGKISSIDYPIDMNAYNRDGSIVPDISIQTSHARQDADKELASMGINMNSIDSIKQNYNTINQVYQKHNLNPKYNQDGSVTENWRRFGVINVAVNNNLLGMDVLDDNPLLSEINDDATIDNLISITKDEKFSKPGIINSIFGGGDHFYKGTLWIPVNSNYQAASIGTKTTGKDVLNIEYAQQARDARNNWKSGRQPK